jgi:hypothetical protein
MLGKIFITIIQGAVSRESAAFNQGKPLGHTAVRIWERQGGGDRDNISIQ